MAEHADAVRLAADLARALGDLRVVTAGDEEEPSPEVIEGAVLLCLLGTPADEDATLDRLVRLRGMARACVVGVAATEPAVALRWHGRLEGAGLAVAWWGLVRKRPTDLRCTGAAFVVGDGDELAELTASGPRSLALDGHATAGGVSKNRLRVAIASHEAFGPSHNNGIATAVGSLAAALAAAGHEVSVLYTGYAPQGRNGELLAEWRERNAALGIEFHSLPSQPARYDCFHHNARRSFEAYRWLRKRDAQRPWDFIHFPDAQGHGYYAALARSQGIAFTRATLTAWVYGCTRWSHEGNGVPMDLVEHHIDDFLERRLIELADVAIAASADMLAWLERHGWSSPRRTYVQQHVLPPSVGLPSTGAVSPIADGGRAREPTRELVFFGRLEHRKGVWLFCDALDLLAGDEEPPDISVTFLGGHNSPAAPVEVRRRAEGWPWQSKVLSEVFNEDALAYVRVPGRLVVTPSLADNSPNVTYELLGMGTTMVASRAGGIEELIDPRDLSAVTFDPFDPVATVIDAADTARRIPAPNPHALADALREAMRARCAPARFAVDPEVNRRTIVRWHERVAGAAVVAPASIELAADELPAAILCVQTPDAEAVSQDHPRVQLVAVDERDGAARNAAVRALGGAHIVFLDGACTAEPSLVSALARVAHATGADAVLCAVGYDDGGEAADAWQGFVPVGGPVLEALVSPGATGGPYLVTRTAFEAAGGFAEEAQPGWADHELLARIVLAGASVEVVPLSLARRPRPADARFEFEDASRGGAVSTADGSIRALLPFHERLEPKSRDLATLTRSQWWRLRAGEGERHVLAGQLAAEQRRADRAERRVVEADKRALTAEHERKLAEQRATAAEHYKRVYEESLSWRLTRPLRWLGRRRAALRNRG